MTEKPLVSIIVPIYNAQDHIARCVESIRIAPAAKERPGGGTG